MSARIGRLGGRRLVALAVTAAIGAAVLAAPAARAADDGLRVARGNACMGCHAVDHKLVGPSFKDVAARYKNDPAAADKLAKKIRDGGSGVWGVIPMPAHPGMSDADIKSVVKWVLAGAPSN
ncbi:c-type cytochrome [Burkholderia perseverans]|uniref:c-type cytochrome n=1 Tax=Burkholderia perseverans TaxID=2615214 RepID=UPI001FF02F8D|nr:c-type cytochrome [Burkholderia perseverans]